jgi:DNA-binding response OmpR family regulator
MTDKQSDNLLSGRTAIILDTEAILVMHLRKVLQRAGIQVLDAIWAADGQKIADNHRPDFVLLDVGPSVTDGAGEGPVDSATTGSCLILLSHLSDAGSRALVQVWGADGYIRKPMDHEQILARLKEAWENADRRERNRGNHPDRDVSSSNT